MKKILLLSSLSIGIAATAALAQTVVVQAPPPPPAVVYAQPAPQPYCREYTDKITIAGESRITHGTACLQPDGSWALQPSQAPVNYVVRGNGLYLVPVQPFTTVIIDDHHHHYHDDYHYGH